MRKLTVGILAHVDAGKTTLSEAMLYVSGSIRKLGRVDKKDAFLDTYELERERGITIFSKQAQMTYGDLQITLVDTPGHVDFSAEMERTLQILDYAILVIGGMDGVQGHTITLWRLLKRYHVPVFVFVNKMDRDGADREALLREMKQRLHENCMDFSKETVSGTEKEAFYEQAAMTEEAALEEFLETGELSEDKIKDLIRERKIFPCFFGSALKVTGVEEFLDGIESYTRIPSYPAQFGAKVFKITRDGQGNRLTFLKITGGSLKVRSLLETGEKVNQLRIYSGEKYETVNEADAGSICAATGLSGTYPGQGLGIEQASPAPALEPVLTYRILLPENCDPAVMLSKLRQLEEEEPQLHIVWNEELQEIQAQLMGEIQIEILKHLIAERFQVEAAFGAGHIVYKETIQNAVEGVGHFEPLKHYAEVHLLLEPAEPGSGLTFCADCSEDELDKNWQRLVLTHLEEKEHKGVLTGSVVTDMKVTLVAGRAHQKHTEGGDFRQATYRALRQGLMVAKSVLLEPVYELRLEVPEEMTGRAMTDLEKLCLSFELIGTQEKTAILTGTAPVALIRDYPKEVNAYTKGQGRIFMSFKGYAPCHNEAEVIEQSGYDPERDTENPTGSVFCAHGAGFVVEWDKVRDYMHVESTLLLDENGVVIEKGRLLTGETEDFAFGRRKGTVSEREKPAKARLWESMGTEEIDRILEQTFYANSRNKSGAGGKMPWKRTRAAKLTAKEWKANPVQKKEEYLLVDGYNVIFTWEKLRELSRQDIDSAKGRLLDILCDYQGVKGCNLIVVFDAYRVKGHDTEISDYHNIHVVYTKEAQTADQYIEKFAHENGKKWDITVATSDGLEQIIIRGQGCRLLSARELEAEVARTRQLLREEYLEKPTVEKSGQMEELIRKSLEQRAEIKAEKKAEKGTEKKEETEKK